MIETNIGKDDEYGKSVGVLNLRKNPQCDLYYWEQTVFFKMKNL